MTTKKPSLVRFIRNPQMRYTFERAPTANYIYCTVKRWDAGNVLRQKGPIIYNSYNIPKWVWEGMELIDLAVDPLTKQAHIPGFGGKFNEKYFFYEEGNENGPMFIG